MNRIIEFSGIEWIVKKGESGPGLNHWSDSTHNVRVDSDGHLQLRV